MKPKILLAAIAKNEAAYLPEWIFYHLNIGIDGIVVYVNNTTDNSLDVLDKIAENHPIEYKIVDGIENTGSEYYTKHISPNWLSYSPLQSKSYADIYRNTRSDEYDYILYLDIDEFLCLDRPIHELLTTSWLGKDSVLFRWFSMTGERTPFLNLEQNLKGEYDQFCKFLVKSGCEKIWFESCHKATINSVSPTFYSNGVVIHRVLRSKSEYIALLSRSNPSKKVLSNGFKLNRRGWTSRAKQKLPSQYFYLFDHYQEKFNAFCQSNNITNDIVIAQKSVLKRAEHTQDQLQLLVEQNNQLGKVLHGTGLTHFNFFSWLKYEIVHRLIIGLCPSLKIKHIPFVRYLKYKFKIISSDEYL